MSKDLEMLEKLKQLGDSIRSELGKLIIGHEQVIEHIILCLIANGHALLVGVPGIAKTLLVNTLSKTMGLTFNRIQFTPDLMPSDIIGTEIIEEDKLSGTRAFKLVKGPVFSNIVLADEINRTPPKTQAAMLQCMQERIVTIGGKTLQLPNPFFVLATQNPIEQEGTYPLPEAQLDRFMFEIHLDYPNLKEELKIARDTTSDYSPDINILVEPEHIFEIQNFIRRIPVPDDVITFAVKLARSTRPQGDSATDFTREMIRWGAGPRASQYLILGAKARAGLYGSPHPTEEDVLAVASPVLRHRILVSFNAEAQGISSEDIINKIVKNA
ncbi:MAG: MoxR family ATPase [bacterium]